MTIIIRKASEEDALEIGTLHTLSWQVAYKGIIKQSFLDEISALKRIAKWREILGNCPPQKTILVACEQDKVLGFISGDVVEEYKDRYYLHALYVHPSHVGKGIGKDLFDGFKASVAQLCFAKIACTVLTENEVARRFYKREGGVEQPNLSKTFQTPDGCSYPEEVCYFDIK